MEVLRLRNFKDRIFVGPFDTICTTEIDLQVGTWGPKRIKSDDKKAKLLHVSQTVPGMLSTGWPPPPSSSTKDPHLVTQDVLT